MPSILLPQRYSLGVSNATLATEEEIVSPIIVCRDRSDQRDKRCRQVNMSLIGEV